MQTSQSRYLLEVNGIVARFTSVLTAEELAEALHLIEHGEPAEGLRTLAWTLQEKAIEVSPALRQRIMELVTPLVPVGEMPEDFAEAIPEPKR